MKAKVVIEQGKTKIVLTPENEFETDIIEKIVDSKVGYSTETTVDTNYSYHTHTNHRMEINLIEKETVK